MVATLRAPVHVFHDDLFGGLSASTISDFEAIENRLFYAEETVLFSQDEPAWALFVIHSGSVAVSHPTYEDESAGTTAASAGEVLGLSAAMAGEPYPASARTVEVSEIGLVSRADLLDFLATHSDFAFGLVRLLSDDVANALEHLRALPPVQS